MYCDCCSKIDKSHGFWLFSTKARGEVERVEVFCVLHVYQPVILKATSRFWLRVLSHKSLVNDVFRVTIRGFRVIIATHLILFRFNWLSRQRLLLKSMKEKSLPVASRNLLKKWNSFLVVL